MPVTPPDNPAGVLEPVATYDEAARREFTAALRSAPARLRESVAGLTENQLDTPYKNWTIRQITHHIADSHVHSYIRFKWSLTEPNPVIKAYEGLTGCCWMILSRAVSSPPWPYSMACTPSGSSSLIR